MLVGVFWLQSSLAFNFDSHRIICQMAYEQLSVKTQQAVEQVISKSKFKRFAQACPWPDQIRQQPSYKHTKYWHYINVPRSANTVSMHHCPKKGCVLSGIVQMQHRLQQDPNNWQSLVFLSHFIGDVHQPLHVSYADDYGGNAVHLKHKGAGTNLHALWDGELLQPKQWQKYSDELLLTLSASNKEQWRNGSIETWATESLLITKDIYKHLPASKKITQKYTDRFAHKLEQQIQKASVRLAYVLEEIYE